MFPTNDSIFKDGWILQADVDKKLYCKQQTLTVVHLLKQNN